MIPRYLPAASFRMRSLALRKSGPDAAAALVSALLPGHALAGCLPLAALRDGLNLYFRDLAQRVGHGAVVMSAQICPLVPLAARYAGFAPRFVDIAKDRPVPAGEQFAGAIDASAKAVVVAPLYGHPPASPEALLGALGDRPLLLDLAQGIGLRGLDALVGRADAVGFSFGIGKGLDTGGGMLLTRKSLDVSAAGRMTLGVGALVRGALLRGIAAAGLYGLAARAVGRAADADPEDFEPGSRILKEEAWVYGWWHACLPAFLAEVEVARVRAASLHSRLRGHPALAHVDACFSPEATHLRQVVRLADAIRRDRTVGRLRALGIDSAPAGEPLPSQYIPGEAGVYPAAAQFRSDAIRLPFLGRLAELQFSRLSDALEQSLG